MLCSDKEKMFDYIACWSILTDDNWVVNATSNHIVELNLNRRNIKKTY